MGKTNTIACKNSSGRASAEDGSATSPSKYPASAMTIALSLFAAVGFPVICFFDGVTALFVLFTALMTVHGYTIGATKALSVFGGLITGALLCVPVGLAVEDLYPNMFELTGMVRRLVSIGLSALAITVLASLALHATLYRLLKPGPRWQRYDPWVGSGMGLAEGFLIGLVFLWALITLEPIAASSLAHHKPLDTSVKTTSISQHFIDYTQTARNSAVGWLADTFNPLDEIRQVALLADGILVLGDPDARTAFTNHHAIQDLQNYPSVKQALAMLAADPDVVMILETGSTAEVIHTVLTSPTLLDIFDETSILEDLTPLADDIEQAIEQAMEHRKK